MMNFRIDTNWAAPLACECTRIARCETPANELAISYSLAGASGTYYRSRWRCRTNYPFLITRRSVLLVAYLLVAWIPVVGDQSLKAQGLQAQGPQVVADPADSKTIGNPRQADLSGDVPVWANLGRQIEGPVSVLYLTDGDRLAGRLMPSRQQNVLRWQGQAFTEPFDFALENISAVQFAISGHVAQQVPSPAVDFGFELAGGDLLYGNLVGLTADKVELEVPGLGRVQVRRQYLKQIVRRQGGGELIYLGPTQSTDWLAVPSATAWREDAGHLVTSRQGAMLRGNFSLPARARIEIELSWEKECNFVLALGATEGILETTEEALDRAFRLEVWEDQRLSLRKENRLVALKESDSEADVAGLVRLKRAAGRIHLILLLDQTEGVLRVLSAAGQPLGEVRAGHEQTEPGERLWLWNRGGRLCLEGIRVSRWDGSFSRRTSDDQTIVERLAGSAVMGTLERFDVDTGELVFGGEQDPQRVRLDEVAAVRFSQVRKLPPLTLHVSFQDGCRFHGELLKVDGNRREGNHLAAGRFWMVSPAVAQPLAWPVAQLRSLVVLPAAQSPTGVGKHRGFTCRLETVGTQLHGALVVPASAGVAAPAGSKNLGGEEASIPTNRGESAARPVGSLADNASCLHWQPRGCSAASPLKQSVAARIVYRDPPAPKPKARRKKGKPRPQSLPPGVWGALMKALANQDETTAHKVSGSPMLYLRSGDTIPCEVTRIDSEGIHFKTPLSAVRFVSHDQVKAAVLARSLRKIVLSKAKRLRLLTLPRMQQENPPTHLICSVTGDYLRGRLLGMDGQTLQMEVRLEAVSVPRAQVSHIIWFHEDELADTEMAGTEWAEIGQSTMTQKLDSTEEPKKAASLPGPLRVQAVRGSGVRMTFVPQRSVADDKISPLLREATNVVSAHWRHATALMGTSPVLGDCRVELKNIDRLLLGGAIEQEAVQLAPQGWRLRHAQQLKIAGAGSSSRIPGTASALVGRSAPAFELELLGGGTFRLRDSVGKVVVLDFWASWCGPCMQTMPRVKRLIRELPGDQVQLVAINLQEMPDTITSTLQRHGLEMVVALDPDGVVAEKYTVTAIPQTVVIDQQGNVARLLVGGGTQLVEQLREALEGLLGVDAAKPGGD